MPMALTFPPTLGPWTCRSCCPQAGRWLRFRRASIFRSVLGLPLETENYSCRTKLRLRSHVRQYPKAAWNAIEAVFDGVEIQIANGYLLVLLVQFFQTVLIERTDEYGRSIDNRIHFPLEVVHVVVETIGIGAERTAVCISPWSKYQGEENLSLIFSC